MPKKNPEYGARLELRLPEAMLRALRWTAEHDKLPLSGWIRDALNRRCFSAAALYERRTPIGKEALISGRLLSKSGYTRLLPVTDIIQERDTEPEAEPWAWQGGRSRNSREIRTYQGHDERDDKGNLHTPLYVNAIPAGKGNQNRQDLWLERGQARTELRNWLHRWGLVGETCRLTDDELRLVRRLLAKFDQDPDDPR